MNLPKQGAWPFSTARACAGVLTLGPFAFGSVANSKSIRLANPGYTLFGSLVYPSGEGVYTIHQRKRAADLLEQRQLVIDLDPDVYWFVVLENASAHTPVAVDDFALQNQAQLQLVYLPTYSSHLNLIERL